MKFIRWLVEVYGPGGFEEVREVEPPLDRAWWRPEDRDAFLAQLRREPRFRDAHVRFLVDGVDGIFTVYAGVEPPPPGPREEVL
jgi:hypothetical protein